MRYSQRGFSTITSLLSLIVLVVVGFAGWRVYQSAQVARKTVQDAAATTLQPASHKRIVVVGDIVCDPKDTHLVDRNQSFCQDYATLQQAKQINPDAILALGDLQYEDGAPEKFQNVFAKSWGSLSDKMYPAPGNHEYATPGASGYYSYFKDSPQDVSKGYYSFTLGDWHIISLDSNCDKIGGCGPDSQQIKWLEEDLRGNKAKCTLAFWHHPRFSSGRYMNDPGTKNRSEQMWAKLLAYRADVVLNGHDHLYERFAPQTAAGEPSEQGIRQFVVGTGGKSHYAPKTAAQNSEKIVDNQYGVLVMDLYGSAYKWQFKAATGQVLDSGHQQCK